jgi:anti-sigma regulatory factor (Ser/Thr protein kinase)
MFAMKKKKKRPSAAIKQFLLENIDKNPSTIVSVTSQKFHVSAVAVQKHLRQLAELGKIIKGGNTRGTRWVLAPENIFKETFLLKEGLDEDLIFRKFIEPKLLPQNLASNVLSIIRFGFTEMVNNVIDHSLAKKLEIELTITRDVVSIKIKDNGIGIFLKLQKSLKLGDIREVILELTKGKVTTDPHRHTGEGIFFTSRAFDSFCLESNGMLYLRDNLINDFTINQKKEDEEISAGTLVSLRISTTAPTVLHKIFDQYTDRETFQFNRTHILVELAKDGQAEFISRSQAKRILNGLEKFDHVTLDFRNVEAVGQGFVDEIFRVFSNAHPKTKFEVVNANDNVRFMINRGLAVR